MKGVENTYRTRIGDYRILYKIYPDEQVVVVIKIAHRKQVYR
ncbi:MAG: type II toxin-antitoxin system RelE/ParE family toxin [Candidatus Heimdallarchaeota archaeon]|nr:type II toxin-antitoxin system RelE/ParE family toxin [Candidatus Heimdallarchaeota archaeon]MCK4611962.1 type II toxin-antitoxin system RelE/ParE family toxin [Candidatus Heimdallarchaeota archaeon]